MFTPIRRVKRREPLQTTEPQTPKKARLAHENQLLTPPNTPSIYSPIKSLFQRGSRSRQFVGRQVEKQQIEDFITSRLNKSGGALYVSGVSGTGKSALVARVFDDIKAQKASINCMTVEKPEHIYETILGKFGYKPKSGSAARSLETMRELVTTGNKSHVVMLDEIDHIMQGDQQVLFQLFEWSCLANTNLILIGVANSLDLTDQLLPRLQAHELRPQVLAVKPYTQADIQNVLGKQLEEYPDLVEDGVFKLFAAKVAAQSGDLRRAFDLVDRALLYAEEDWRKESSEAGKAVALKPVTMVHALRACRDAFAGDSSITRIGKLNHIQKTVLVTLLLVDHEARQHTVTKSITMNDLFVKYKSIAEEENTWELRNQKSFIEVVSALESYSLLQVNGVCGRRGLGNTLRGRVSHGGGGAGGAQKIEGNQLAYMQRRVMISVQAMDVMSAMDHPSLVRVLQRLT